MSTVDSIKRQLKSAKQWLRYTQLPSSEPSKENSARSGSATCVISAADPGGLGDAAMVRAISDQYSAEGVDITCWRYPDAPAFVGTRHKVDVRLLKGDSAEATLAQYARVGCVGADVMDGLYAYADSCLRLRLLGLAAAMGIESRLFGFSFNASPHPKTAFEFKRLHRDVVVCARDPISYERLQAVTDHPLRLVADMAFLVKANQPCSPQAVDVLQWLGDQRQTHGRQVIGLNVHPMFSFDHGSGITDALVRAFVALVNANPDSAFVMIPHDFRPVFGDVPALQSVLDALDAEGKARVRLVADIHDPADLKGFVGHLDGVLTGRMHLAIAAMGQGVPVAGITYQGKFEGLLQHFELGDGLTIAPPDAADAQRLIKFFSIWQKGLDRQAASIRHRLPAVAALSALNFG